MSLNWKDFGQHDWDAFAGANCFNTGAPPQVAEVFVDGEPGVAVWDAKGVGIFVADGEDEPTYVYPGASQGLLAVLREEMSSLGLRKLGFRTMYL